MPLPHHARLISFALYDAHPKYTLNAVINCLLAIEVYPGWTCRFYVDGTVPQGIRHTLRAFSHVEVVDMPTHRGPEARLWRFLPAATPELDAMISRDADSWLSYREAACVERWLESGKSLHIIRDHCYHRRKIMAGLWGIKGGVLPHMTEWVETYSRRHTNDQVFLAENVYPRLSPHAVVHASPQYDSRGQFLPAGYFDEGALPLPEYPDIDEPIPGLSFREAHRLNAFHCVNCRQTHAPFLGGALEHIPSRALQIVISTVRAAGVAPSSIPGLG